MFENEARAARAIAVDAGTMLVDLRAAGGRGSELRTAGDKLAHDLIVARIARRFPDDAIVSEEAADDDRRIDHRRVWIVDPLDGTQEFSEPPRDDWAVHVAFVADGELVAGAVALPARGLTFGTVPAPVLPPLHAGAPRLVVSRTRPAAEATELARRLSAELVPMGSAGAKAMAVVMGDAEVYAHSGGQYEWDSAAPVAVAAAAGLHVSRLDGSPLRYNQPSLWLPDLLICRPELADTVLALRTSVESCSG